VFRGLTFPQLNIPGPEPPGDRRRDRRSGSGGNGPCPVAGLGHSRSHPVAQTRSFAGRSCSSFFVPLAVRTLQNHFLFPYAESSGHPPSWFPPARPHRWQSTKSTFAAALRRSTLSYSDSPSFSRLLGGPLWLDPHLGFHPHQHIMSEYASLTLAEPYPGTLALYLRLEIQYGKQQIAHLLADNRGPYLSEYKSTKEPCGLACGSSGEPTLFHSRPMVTCWYHFFR